jgi:hypothetical protein
MKALRKTLATAMLIATILVGSTFAGDGIIIAGLAEKQTQPCTTTKGETTKVDNGIIVTDLDGIIIAGFTGIIIAGFTGIIIAGAKQTPVDCGIIIAG